MEVEHWEKTIARRVIKLILEANHGFWPQTLSAWRIVANRFGNRLRMSGNIPVYKALVHEDVIHAPYAPHHRFCMNVAICHEVAEIALIWEGEPEYNIASSEAMQTARHRVASLVTETIYGIRKDWIPALTLENVFAHDVEMQME